MSDMLPNRAYYMACEGKWRSRLSFELTDLGEVWRAYRLLDVCSILWIIAWPGWLGKVWLETTVHNTSERDVVHTTKVRWLGMTLMSSVEQIALREDGRGFEMRGESRTVTSPLAARAVSGVGEISADSERASYTLTWLGAPFSQETERARRVVTIRMTGRGFMGEQRLAHITPS